MSKKTEKSSKLTQMEIAFRKKLFYMAKNSKLCVVKFRTLIVSFIKEIPSSKKITIKGVCQKSNSELCYFQSVSRVPSKSKGKAIS